MAARKDRTAVVTGSTRGIGRAIADALVARGCRVVVSARTETDVERTAAELARRGGGDGVLGVRCDVRAAPDCARLMARTVERFGGIDILVNNAGVGRFGAVGELTLEAWDETIGTNLSGAFYCSHHALPHLRRSDDAWIVNIGSLAGKNPFPGGAAYNASKFALVGFSEAMMQDVRHQGVRVTYIMPGSVATDFGSGGGAEWKIQPEDIAAHVLHLLDTPARTLPSRIEIRPSRPPRK